jgi:hypothetical protein
MTERIRTGETDVKQGVAACSPCSRQLKDAANNSKMHVHMRACKCHRCVHAIHLACSCHAYLQTCDQNSFEHIRFVVPPKLQLSWPTHS